MMPTEPVSFPSAVDSLPETGRALAVGRKTSWLERFQASNRQKKRDGKVFYPLLVPFSLVARCWGEIWSPWEDASTPIPLAFRFFAGVVGMLLLPTVALAVPGQLLYSVAVSLWYGDDK